MEKLLSRVNKAIGQKLCTSRQLIDKFYFDEHVGQTAKLDVDMLTLLGNKKLKKNILQ